MDRTGMLMCLRTLVRRYVWPMVSQNGRNIASHLVLEYLHDGDSVNKMTQRFDTLCVSPHAEPQFNDDAAYKDICRMDVSEIYPHLFLSGVRGACSDVLWETMNVTQIISVGCKPSAFNKLHKDTVFHYINLADEPMEPIALHFCEVSKRICQTALGGGGTLVHCQMGISRSATLVIAHIMMTERKTYEDALAFVRSKRPQVDPNPGFVRALHQLEVSFNKN